MRTSASAEMLLACFYAEVDGGEGEIGIGEETE